MIYTQFVVYGTPAPQGSKRHVGRGILVESSKKVAPWREAVKWAAIEIHQGKPPMEGPIYVHVSFMVPRLKKLKPGQRPITRSSGDIDKLLRATFDAITDSGMIRDDSQIVVVSSCKSYAQENEAPGALIRVGVQE